MANPFIDYLRSIGMEVTNPGNDTFSSTKTAPEVLGYRPTSDLLGYDSPQSPVRLASAQHGEGEGNLLADLQQDAIGYSALEQQMAPAYQGFIRDLDEKQAMRYLLGEMTPTEVKGWLKSRKNFIQELKDKKNWKDYPTPNKPTPGALASLTPDINPSYNPYLDTEMGPDPLGPADMFTSRPMEYPSSRRMKDDIEYMRDKPGHPDYDMIQPGQLYMDPLQHRGVRDPLTGQYYLRGL